MDNHKAEISFQMLEASKMLYQHEDLHELKIIYKNKNIAEDSLNILIWSIRVKNTGDKDIFKNMFDNNAPLGLLIENGNIVDAPKIVEASSSYLRENVKLLTNDSLGKITFSDFILDKDDFFTIRVLVIYSNIKIPKLTPIGKISGIKEIKITDERYPKARTPSALSMIIFLGLVGLLYFFGSYHLPKKYKNERQEIVERFIEKNADKSVKNQDLLFEYYINSGLGFLHTLHFYINKPGYIKHFTGLGEGLKLVRFNMKLNSGYMVSCNKFFSLFSNFTDEKEKLVSDDFKEFLMKFTEFVEEENFKYYSK